jgi:hypothetical protein
MARRSKKKRPAPRHRKVSHRRICKKVCTVCGNAYPKGKLTPKKYTAHVRRWHTSSVYC